MSNPFIAEGRTYCPIIFLRGYAMRRGDIEAAVNDPFSGFNDGSTKFRQEPGSSEIGQRYFESPVIRLATDHRYRDVYHDGREPDNGTDLLRATGLSVVTRRDNYDPNQPIDLNTLTRAQLDSLCRSMWVCRYYEQSSKAFGDGDRRPIPVYAATLADTIERIRRLYSQLSPAFGQHFRVILVAHSMGGLVVRSYLQNVGPRWVAQQRAPDVPVARVFTYGTPHNGIEVKLFGNNINIGLFDIENFARGRIATDLAFPAAHQPDDPVNGLNDHFDPRRFFCLVGTNHKDYDVAPSRAAVDPRSDGLVLIKNATVQGSPRAHVPRAHSGPYGMVNSEDGYQNLQRFLFGDIRVNAKLRLARLPLPKDVQLAIRDNKRVRGNIYFDVAATVRGSFGWYLTQRLHRNASAVWRTLDDLYDMTTGDLLGPQQPIYLCSTFMDQRKIEVGRHIAFQLQLAITSDGIEIDRKFWMDKQFGIVRFLELKLDLSYYINSGNLRVQGPGQHKVSRTDNGFSVAIAHRQFAGDLLLEVAKNAP